MAYACRWAVAAGLCSGLAVAAVWAQSRPSSTGAAAYVAAAKEAAGREYAALFDRLCTPVTTPPAPQAAQRPAPQPQGPPDRSRWHAEPVKVFDNLYFVGEKEYSAWAVLTSEGIIIIDPIFDYSVEDEVVNGLTTLGADPARIRYVIVSHGHRDHAGGARFLQERFGAHVIMGDADWDLLEADTGTWPKPTRDMVAADGQKLTLGDTTLTFFRTPGHTLGTISTLIPVKDGSRSHLAALWGGTAFNWLTGPARYITPERPASFWFELYRGSARRFRDVAARANADVILSNHTAFDGSKAKLVLVATRRPGEPHPYVVGIDGVRRYLTVAEECAKAGLAR